MDNGFYGAKEFNYCGIQVLSPEYLKNIIHCHVFSIIDEHLAQAKEHPIELFRHDGLCFDLGTPEAIKTIENGKLKMKKGL